MAKMRSANYPALSLGDAIKATAAIYKAEHRSKASRDVLSRALGYSGLHGRAQRKLAALREFGLLDGVGDELSVSEDGVTLIHAPDRSVERAAVLRRAALRPALFQELYQHFEGKTPSQENLSLELRKRGFTEQAVRKIVRAYVGTVSLIPDHPDDNRGQAEVARDSVYDSLKSNVDLDPDLEELFEQTINRQEHRSGRYEQEVFVTSLFGTDMVRNHLQR